MRVSEIISTLALAVGAATASGPLSSKQRPFSDKAFETLDPLMKAYMKSHRISLVVACPSCDPPALGTGHVSTYPDEYPDCVPNLATGEQGLRIDIRVSEDEMGLPSTTEQSSPTEARKNISSIKSLSLRTIN